MNDTTTLDELRRGELAGATQLALRGGLTELPREVFGLADTLEVLDLSGNALDSLPHDMQRLHRLRVLFCSHNRFTRLPDCLGDCPSLTQIGFRGTGLREIPADALPAGLRWLTLTDNRIDTLPEALGERPHLQKLMLSGNQLQRLPDSLAGASRLELLRISANRLDSLPEWLAELPRLAWLAYAGNPLNGPLREVAPARTIAWRNLQPGQLLGEGSSGRVQQVLWQPPDEAPRELALKLFKGSMTSDGLPDHEVAASLTAGEHPALTGALGRLAGHPEQAEGLLMTLLPAGWSTLAGPPSLASCTRDIYPEGLRLEADTVRRIARSVATAADHLHRRRMLHGDLYAHNILWDGHDGEAVLSDLGAASFLPDDAVGTALPRTEVLAWGLLLGELLDRCVDPPENLYELQRECVLLMPSERPVMTEVLSAIGA
ncbi:leucine-rich repeat-containing protein kinase family protein [Lichenicola sp.]|uniref:leucine-rich repeat-containing protein kinase family protein n=1 Tax=Lichenicola sp. TaxID=2804529 RepID=UPI003AFF8233